MTTNVCPRCWRAVKGQANYDRHLEACRRNVPEVHTTDRGLFKACRQKWEFGSNLRMNLEPARPVENFAFGEAIHRGIAAFYQSSLVPVKDRGYRDTRERDMDAGVADFLAELDNWWQRIDSPTEEDEEAFDNFRTMGESMLWQYARFSLYEDNFDVLWTERTFHLPIWTHTKSGSGRRLVTYSFRTDGLVRDRDGRYWILEFKTASRIPDRTDYLLTDDQCGAYIWALQHFPEEIGNIPIEGVLYRWLKKKVPPQMKTLNRGGLSTDKRQDLPYYLAVKQIKAHHDGQVPASYREFLDHLKERGDTYTVQEFVRRSEDEIRNIGAQLPFEVADMVNDPAIYRTPSQFNCNGCQFLGMCVLKWEGGDWESMLESYQQREDRYA